MVQWLRLHTANEGDRGSIQDPTRHVVQPKKMWGFPHSSVGKESACSAGDLGSIPGSGRSPAEGNGNPLQYSCLENPVDRGAWQATVSPWGHKELDITD